MIKSFKKGLALVLAAAMVFSTPIAVNPTKADAAESDLPAAVATFDFTTEDGVTIDNTAAADKGIAIKDGSLVMTDSANYAKIENPLKGKVTEGATIEYDFTIANDAIDANIEYGTVLGFETPNMAFSPMPYACYNGTDGWTDIKGTLPKAGTKAHYTFVVTNDGIQMYVDGVEIKNPTVTGDATFAKEKLGAAILKSINESSEAYFGKGAFWGAAAGTLDNVKFYDSAMDSVQVYKAATGKDGRILVADPKISIVGKNLEISFSEGMYKPDSVEVKVNDTVVEKDENGKYLYTPDKSGTYQYTITGKKENIDDTVLMGEIAVSVTDDGLLFDAELASDFAVVKGGASYGFTAKKLFDDVTYTIEVSESGKVVATLKEGETLDFSKLTSGKEYTAKLIAKKDGYATKTYTAEKFKYEAAAKATTPTNFANITTQPVVKYTFDNADGLTLNGDAKVVDGVLNLANTTTQHNNSWAKIADITKYDFSKGMTITSDVKVTSWVGDWSKIILLGNIKGFKKFSEMAEGDVAYGITEGFMSCIDVDKGIKTGYYGGGQAVTAGTAKEGAAPLGTTAMPLVYNWYADTTKQNRWDTITVTITPTEMITYYDGVKVQSYKDDYTVILNAMKKASENYLGTSYFSDDFDFAGALDNVGIYDTALSADEVSKLSEAKADNTAAKPTEQGSQQATAAKNKSLFFTDWSAAYGKKKVTGELNTSGATVTVKVGKKAAVKATVKGKTFTAKVAKLTKGTKVVITAKKDGYSTATKTITVKAPMKVKSVKAKKGTKKVTGTISVKGATVKVKVGKKAYKKAKVKGKKFTLKVAKLKKGTKVKVQATKKNYKTATKTVKVK